MKNRLDMVQEKLASAPFDVLALIPGPNYFYVSGAPLHASERMNLLLLPKEGVPVALAPVLEAPYLRPLGLQVYGWRDEEGPQAALEEMLRDLGVKDATIGVEFGVMRFGEGQRLREAVPGVRFEAADGFLSGLRSCKDEDEIKAIRHAIEVTERGLQRTIDAMRVGQTEREVAAMLQINLLQEGADSMAFGPLVVSGPRSAEPHAGPSDRVIQPGDAIIIDCGATVNHYSGDITRCVAVEPVPKEIEFIYDLCLAANEAGRAIAKAGVSGHQIDLASRTVIDEGDFGEFFIHRTGHGLGLEIHEPPYIVAGNHDPLQIGHLFTVEPGIYLPNFGGVRVEDNIVVTADGCETLTTFPRELIRIG
ncbi:MAG: M24 family metallopeptidase [Ardenticatenaceae bacterium]